MQAPNSMRWYTIFMILCFCTGAVLCQDSEQIKEARVQKLRELSASVQKSKQPQDRIQMLQSMSTILSNKNHRDPTILPKIKPLLADASPEVRHETLRVVAAFEDPASMEEVRKMAFSDPDRRVRRSAIYALSRCGKEKALGDLKQLSQDPDKRIQLDAATALGDLGDESGYSLAIQSLNDADKDIRHLGLEALGHIGRVDAKKAIEKAFAGHKLRPTPSYEALMRIDLHNLKADSDRLDYLKLAMKDPVGERRRVAVWALAAMQDSPQAMDLLKETAQDTSHPAYRFARSVALHLSLITE